jgi:integrase
MIYRQNWLDVREWLHHQEHVQGRHEKTIRKNWMYLRHLIEWADETPLHQAHKIFPSFPTYLQTARNDGKGRGLSYITIYKALSTTRMYFEFALKHWPRYQKLNAGWIDLLVPNRDSKPQPSLEEHKYYALEEVRAIATVSAATLREERAKAAACMLYLSGMRADTFASLPRQCVDLPNMRIYQVPSMGPRTKNNKAAITYLLNIPDLLSIVQQWDGRLRQLGFAPSALWYAPLNHDGMSVYESATAIKERSGAIRDDIILICKKAGIRYLSPHRFRHGHIVYARSHARTQEEVKAVSQNVMHANTIITDQVYGGLTSNQVRNVITSLGASNTDLDKTEILRLIDALKAQLS